ncbi:MAG TPA: UDP-N-acetylmuramoyl-L-alanyl-D-glutamate--2,6-diaminopimelate ligase [Gemmatimonadales bacterium]|nr:UDP-N-acetylmuramoyl-L-alanyl-D-glutamate--2,6-diaminopimelate ligase [Gemmatimonadales bacterium]
MVDWNELIAALRRAGVLVQAPADGVVLTGLGIDTRTIAPGELYCAVRGTTVDGHDFAAEAVARGAVAVMGERPTGTGVLEILVTDGRRAASAAARAWYGEPAAALTLIGITGTNGKTTTTGLVRHLFNAGGTAGSIGTLGAYDGAGERVPSTAGSLTTPGPVDLHATFAKFRERGVTHIAMEASSHSLDQGRLDGLSFAAGVFTNLTHEHLDYHRTMEAYLAAKMRLSALLGPAGYEIVNADDSAWAALPPFPRRVTFGESPGAEVRAEEVQLAAGGSSFRLAGRFGRADVRIPLMGSFNVANALAAAATALALDQPLAEVVARLGAAPQVPGRMERLADAPMVVLRDYAHTPDAMTRVLATLRPLTPGRLILIFGCGGDRDRTKRPEMARIAVEGADLVAITPDNPRTEDPERIMDDMEAGMGGAHHLRFSDREVAIHQVLAGAGPGDTVLLAGKGHETYQLIGKTKYPFDERSIVQAALAGRA